MLAKLVNITTITVGLIVILNILLDGVINHKKKLGGLPLYGRPKRGQNNRNDPYNCMGKPSVY